MKKIVNCSVRNKILVEKESKSAVQRAVRYAISKNTDILRTYGTLGCQQINSSTNILSLTGLQNLTVLLQRRKYVVLNRTFINNNLKKILS